MDPTRSNTSSHLTPPYAGVYNEQNRQNQPMAALRHQEDRLDAASHVAQSLTTATGSYAPMGAVAQQRGANMAMQGLYANRGGCDSYANEFMLNGRGREPLPPAFIGRGVSASMWDEDIRDLQAIMAAHYKRNNKDCLIVAATCGLYMLKECFGESSDARVEGKIQAKIDDMNSRYSKHGVVFSMKIVPLAGWFVRYET